MYLFFFLYIQATDQSTPVFFFSFLLFHTTDPRREKKGRSNYQDFSAGIVLGAFSAVTPLYAGRAAGPASWSAIASS